MIKYIFIIFYLFSDLNDENFPFTKKGSDGKKLKVVQEGTPRLVSCPGRHFLSHATVYEDKYYNQ